MDKDEALEMAIEAMEYLCEAFMLGADWRGVGVYDSTVDALKACKKALKQPAQKPATYVRMDDDGFISYGQSEPREDLIPLYTHPAPSWQELTDHDIGTISDEVEETLLADGLPEREYVFEFARAIEQEIRERIHG